MKPSRAAEIIITEIEKNRRRMFVGPDSIVMDILYRIHPTGAANLIYTQMRSLLQ